MISQLKEKKKERSTWNSPYPANTPAAHSKTTSQNKAILQAWCDTSAADSLVTPADEHTHYKHSGHEGLGHICIETIFPSVSDPKCCLQYCGSTHSTFPRALQTLSLCLATSLPGHNKLSCSLNLMPSFLGGLQVGLQLRECCNISLIRDRNEPRYSLLFNNTKKFILFTD